MHFLANLWLALLAGTLVTARLPSPASKRNHGTEKSSPSVAQISDSTSPFISVSSDGKLQVNGSTLPYLAMDAYWLSLLTNESDIARIMANVSKLGVTNVVVPAYNLVNEFNVPPNGSNETWLQLLHPNASLTFNEGPNGFQRLDTLVREAKNAGMYIDFTLSNNFDPRALVANQSLANNTQIIVNGFNTTRPRNYLRNDFGGADFISATLGSTSHDFFHNQTIIGVYQDIIDFIVRRYTNETSIASWTPIKEGQCNGTLPMDCKCNTEQVSTWYNNITNFIKERDPNHLVIAGTSGLQCNQDSTDSCPKLFTPTTPPPATTSSTPGRRAPKSKRQIALEQKERVKKVREAERARSQKSGAGVKIRGRWVSNGSTRRQTTGNLVPSDTDGSSGVDSVDLGNSAVGALTSSYLPFERTYFTNQNNSDLGNIIDLGNQWILLQASIRDQLTTPKPVYLTMGVPVKKFSQFFVFANSSVNEDLIFANGTISNSSTPLTSLVRRQAISNSSDANEIGVTSEEQTSIWQSWFNTAQTAGVNIIVQGLGDNEITNTPGTSYSANNDTTSASANNDTTTSSPNDGYNIVASDNSDSSMQAVIRDAANSLEIAQ